LLHVLRKGATYRVHELHRFAHVGLGHFKESFVKNHSRVALLAIAMLGWNAASVSAQNDSREFIESSSPLADGERVISRSEPGRGVQTVITVSPESIARRAERERQNRLDLTAHREARSTSSGDEGAASSGMGNRYPYPAVNRVAFAPNPQVAFQAPTLGIGRVTTAQRAQIFDCQCRPQNYLVQQVPIPATQSPALQAPSLSIQDGTTTGLGSTQPGAFQQVASQPQLAFQNNGSWWDPIATGSGVYRPIIRLSNVKPGTYLGQGIVGQPTAYVDGQPIRNLMRYIFP